MKATETKLLDFLKKSPQFVVPIYQRTYSWTQKECEQLWNDIVRAGTNDSINGHFIGSIVYVEDGLYSVSSQSPLLVIDGQQRLTTITILLEALARKLADDETLPGATPEKIRNYYLLNSLEQGEQRFKLLLTETDKTTLLALVQQQPLPQEYSVQMKNNFEFFTEKLNDFTDLEVIYSGISKLLVVDISLDRQQDNPQLIFESLNSTGKALSEADLIRNFILMGLEPETQNKFYEYYWRPMEKEFGQERYKTDFDDLIRHYLTIKTGSIPKQSEIYEEFKYYALTTAIDTERLIADIKNYATYYCNIVLGKEPDVQLHQAFSDLMLLRADVSLPLILKLYDDYFQGMLSSAELLEATRLVENYVFRRAICEVPTNSMNKTFVALPKKIDPDNCIESLKANFLLLKTYTRFPSDEEFKSKITEKDVYNFRNSHYLLYKLENHGRKEKISPKQYSIEHVLPQNENLNKKWQQDLGENWKEIQEKYVHTLGNLTLTGYNSEYSDRSFTEKKAIEGGFDMSPLVLNQSIKTEDIWNEDSILKRSRKLSELANQIWYRPQIDDETLSKYQPKKVEYQSQWSIEDHKFLQEPKNLRLFTMLREQILALDPNVYEEFKKYYVAYKAESNFAAIKGRKDRLALFINIDPEKVYDPLKLCINKSDVGHQATGHTLLIVKTEEDIKYAISIIQQALELQLG